MAIIKETSYSSDNLTSTLSGNIEINDGTGELIIRRGSNVAVRINSDGFAFSDQQGNKRIDLNSDGFAFSDPQGNKKIDLSSEGLTFEQVNGLRRIRIGEHPVSQEIGEWISKPNIDVINELSR